MLIIYQEGANWAGKSNAPIIRCLIQRRRTDFYDFEEETKYDVFINF